MKLRGHGTSAQVVRALGGTAVSMPMPEVYASLQKGIIEGALYPLEVNKGWQMVVDLFQPSNTSQNK